MRKINFSFAILFMFATLIPAFVAQANMTLLHDWSEPNPTSPYGYSGSAVIWPFTSSTTKNAYIYNAPSSSYYNLSSSASASLSGEPLTNLPKGLLSTEYNASGKVQATSDWDRLEPHSGDGLAWKSKKDDDGLTYNYAEHTKGDHNSPASVKAITKKKKHKVSIGLTKSGTQQRSFSLEASVSHVEMQRTSPTELDSDPWAFAQLTAQKVKVSTEPDISGSPFTSMTPYCLNSGAGHTCSHEGDDGNGNPPTNNNDDPADDPAPANSNSANLSSPTGSSVRAGNSIAVDLTTSNPFSSVYWYIKSPSESGLGSNVEIDYGGSSSYSASMTYTFDSSASGDYVITAYIYNYSDSSVYEATYTVSVSGSSSSSDDTPNCPDCTSHCSSPCSCSNSGTCNGSIASPSPSPTPPSTLVPCAACSGSYDTSWHSSFVEWHTVVKTCEHCGMEFQRCNNYYGFCPVNGTHVEND